MNAWVAAVVLVAGPSDPWDFRPGTGRAAAVTPAGAFLRAEALDDLSNALRRWPQERKQFLLDLEERQRWLERPPEEPEAKDAPPVKIEDATKRTGQPSRFGKVIEVARDPLPDTQPRTWIEDEIGRLEQDQESLEHRKQADPKGYAKEKAHRRTVSVGNRAWDAAVAKRHEEQEAAIEAEALVMQRALDAARRREAEANARRLGGTLDADGNFVDPDLQEKP